MLSTAALTDEPARLAALQRMRVLDTGPEEAFENIVSLVRSVLDVPMAAVSLIDENRQWFKARSGIEVEETARDVSFCRHAIVQREPLVVGDASIDARFWDNPLVTGDPSIRSYAGIPLSTHDGYNLGTLCAIDVRPRVFTEAEVAMLSNFARIVTTELELRRIHRFDDLTGALARRPFLDSMESEIDRHQRYGRTASLVLVDVDHFKLVNDTYGHPGGDAALAGLVRALDSAKRPSDIIGRLGGEEFALLLPETCQEEALVAAERLRKTLEASPITLGLGATIALTASFGIAEIQEAIATPLDWMAVADVALYAAKREGRNRCYVAGH